MADNICLSLSVDFIVNMTCFCDPGELEFDYTSTRSSWA